MPKRRILPFIILGIIKSHPQITGREITDEFNTEIGDFWKASHSQIYPELRRMVDDQWVAAATSSKNAKEKYYSITTTGQQILDEWLSQAVKELPIHQDLFSLKLFFINDPKDPRIHELITNQIALLKQQLAHLKQRQQTVFPDKKTIQKHYGHYLILKRAISRTEGQLAWLNQTLETLN
ncbi:PadR family transcriptional regulator [Limosilactobacillus fastidiosus]|uniref:PadR family transcriptional regulator n=1 Tax=Limosilactobacillus fastidiosus TaxID=2759855 RepID=A0A7W3YC82_9LACO|nr:PadR family transcriptional regulator [Limosilactobacillus fastidiosus]MBB1063492.1 PadR family transcriptional regulator [Limosilactobacillus fastidiosus]MBB1085816.1 PadR family transcriptional regulator [Limosilactobacillus fastidiosus]MCD7084760.1 PadR family transcriptional regulator [Limosilactobacillus fastidiosus]MCD7085847.1 PadR family transcriptional regulator [Limosilactobacillus fastidiosus]MCD7113924.1 PadR family transcriptional regulator [Limosilactobacillus fastidiosus]